VTKWVNRVKKFGHFTTSDLYELNEMESIEHGPKLHFFPSQYNRNSGEIGVNWVKNFCHFSTSDLYELKEMELIEHGVWRTIFAKCK